MSPQPALRDGPRDPGAEVVPAAAGGQKRHVDALDVDAAVLHRLDAVGDLDQLARQESSRPQSQGNLESRNPMSGRHWRRARVEKPDLVMVRPS
jgi:hypothetical protein